VGEEDGDEEEREEHPEGDVFELCGAGLGAVGCRHYARRLDSRYSR
jgi:hypothetical protein